MTAGGMIPRQRRPLELVQGGARSPFDAIRHEDLKRGEWWSGRDLMVLMGYTRWEGFAAVVERAKESLAIVQGIGVVTSNFQVATKITATKPAEDYVLSRFACYLVAMAGDERKARVAEARVYFAVQTRAAELAAPAFEVPQTFGDALRLAASQADEIERQAREIERQRLQVEAQAETIEDQHRAIDHLRPRAEFTETFVDPSAGTTVRDFAKQVGLKEHDVWGYLDGAGITYRDSNGERRAYARYARHFTLKDNSSIEHRNPDGSSHKTLLLTGPGKLWLARRMKPGAIHPVPPSPSWDL